MMTAEMTGTDKQIGWASDIRAEALATLAAYRAQVAGADDKVLALVSNEALRTMMRARLAPASAEKLARIDAAVATLESKTDAGWWINQARGRSGAELVELAAK